jgi:hypothetical protein
VVERGGDDMADAKLTSFPMLPGGRHRIVGRFDVTLSV